MRKCYGQMALSIGFAAGQHGHDMARCESWLRSVKGATDDLISLYHSLCDAFSPSEAFERSKAFDLVTRRGVPIGLFVECIGLFTARNHHQIWDRSWAFANGWPMRVLPFIDGWDFRNRRPVFVKLIER